MDSFIITLDNNLISGIIIQLISTFFILGILILMSYVLYLFITRRKNKYNTSNDINKKFADINKKLDDINKKLDQSQVKIEEEKNAILKNYCNKDK